tara:strand:+ start:415 stop:585 length:171 start_codon:yes stop_codon:yes gene_type:complete
MSGMGDLMVMLPAMLLMNKIDFTDPFNLMLVRTAFIAVQVNSWTNLILLLCDPIKS